MCISHLHLGGLSLLSSPLPFLSLSLGPGRFSARGRASPRHARRRRARTRAGRRARGAARPRGGGLAAAAERPGRCAAQLAGAGARARGVAARPHPHRARHRGASPRLARGARPLHPLRHRHRRRRSRLDLDALTAAQPQPAARTGAAHHPRCHAAQRRPLSAALAAAAGAGCAVACQPKARARRVVAHGHQALLGCAPAELSPAGASSRTGRGGGICGIRGSGGGWRFGACRSWRWPHAAPAWGETSFAGAPRQACAWNMFHAVSACDV